MTGSLGQSGRAFTPADDRPGAAKTAILSHALWQRRFAGDRKVRGQTIKLSDQSFSGWCWGRVPD